MKLVSFTICPFVQRVTATLEAKNIHYQVEYLNLDNPPAWFIEASPNAQVPILITDSAKVLFESDAIVEYLDDIYPPLQTKISAEQRAINRAWSYQASKHYLVQCATMQSPDRETFLNRLKRLVKAFERVEKALDTRPYFQSEVIGNVDLAWLVLLHRSAIIEQYSGYDFIKNYPKIKSWQARLLDRAAASVSEDFNDKFCSFYLSDKTYLGRGQKDSVSTNHAGCCQ